jgi:hypothetical protein
MLVTNMDPTGVEVSTSPPRRWDDDPYEER